MRHGNIRISAKDDDARLMIETPVGEISRLGTEFGISVTEFGATDMYVFEGAVKVKPSGSGLPAEKEG